MQRGWLIVYGPSSSHTSHTSLLSPLISTLISDTSGICEAVIYPSKSWTRCYQTASRTTAHRSLEERSSSIHVWPVISSSYSGSSRLRLLFLYFKSFVPYYTFVWTIIIYSSYNESWIMLYWFSLVHWITPLWIIQCHSYVKIDSGTLILLPYPSGSLLSSFPHIL